MNKSRRRPKIRKTRFQKNIFLALFSLSLIISVIIFGKVSNFFTSLNRPITKDTQYGKSQPWDGKSNINIVVKSGTINVLSYNPHTQEIIILNIPDEVYLNLALGFGTYPARSIYKLGEGEKVPIGPRLLKETMSQTFGVPIDNYILIRQESVSDLEKLIIDIRQNPLTSISLISISNTDLTPLEYLNFVIKVRGVRADRVKVVDLKNSSITKSQLLSDGSRALSFDPVRLDRLIQDEFTDARLNDESLSVAILNGTNHPRLAENAARLITNMGGRVVSVSNSQNKYSKSYVLGESSYTNSRLGQIFTICSQCDINDPETVSSRAQITVILGEDYYQKLNKR